MYKKQLAGGSLSSEEANDLWESVESRSGWRIILLLMNPWLITLPAEIAQITKQVVY